VSVQSIPTVEGLGWTGRVFVSVVTGALFLAALGVAYLLRGWLRDRLEADVAEALQSLFVTAIGLLAAGVLVAVWDLQRPLSEALAVVAVDGRNAALLIVSVVVFGVAYTLTRITKRLIVHRAEHDAISAHQRQVAHHVVQILVFAPAILFVMALWGARPGSFLIGAGAVGIVVGLAARQTLGAMLAGFVLLFARPFEIGDWVVIHEQEGTVTDVTVFNTEIRTFDNEHVLVPNDLVTSTEIVNRSRNNRLRLQVDVGIDYDADPAEAAGIARRAMADCDEVLDEPAPDVVISEFESSSVVLTCRFWIYEPSISRKWEAQNAVIRSVKEAFDSEGIEIPFPQRTVSTREETGAPAPAVHEVSAPATDGGDGDEEDGGNGEDAEGNDRDEGTS
jgi:small-conductance mechanosensitive channel